MSETALDYSKQTLDAISPLIKLENTSPGGHSLQSHPAAAGSVNSSDSCCSRDSGLLDARDHGADKAGGPGRSRDASPLDFDKALPDKTSSDRVAPIRPFKMYPLDTSSLAYASVANAISNHRVSTALGTAAVYEPMFPRPSFAMSPLASQILQRKRRTEPAPKAADGLDENGKKTKPVPEEKKDDAYWERRRKNNEAAKRSRDARRQKEEEIAMRAAYLEQENLQLRAEVTLLKHETARLHYLLYNNRT